ncbi:lytic transglycosylase domain-containing protein [Kineococcus sp. TRM81007]|uniref:lytic transglycosylase domain-containing protein n=1 Tax=Kineococcus sp. TRM81007 TaxID=2925831 RepID=UPI0027E39E93|nr:lytic transglycosylase domain-containing protein [Kineococcus sp. TRM81007]
MSTALGAALAGALLAGPLPAPTAHAAPALAPGAASSAAATRAAEQARAATERAATQAQLVEQALREQRSAVQRAASAAVGAEVTAQRERSAAVRARDEGARRARTLYMGPALGPAGTGAYALVRSLLTGADPAAVLRARELRDERALAAGGRAAGDAAGRASARAASAEAASAAADAAAVDGVGALRELAARSGELQRALREAEERVGALDARAAQLRAAEEAERALAAAREAARASATAAAGATATVRAGGVPADYADLYARAATTCPGVRPALLQAVGQVESGHGRNVGPSSAGAIGPMQFMPATFAAYGVDGDGDGDTDAWDPADAVFSAARYLCANGAGAGRAGEAGALFRYNRADWYVAMVQRIADELDAGS